MTEREQIKEELRKEYQELYMNESRFNEINGKL